MEKDSAAEKANAGSGWDEVEEQKVEESKAEVKVEETDADKEEQVFSTKLGRKVKAQSEEMEQLKATNQQLLDAVTRLEAHLSESKAEKAGAPEDRLGEDLYDQMCSIEPPPVEFVTTPKEQVLMAQWEKRVSAKMEAAQRGVYENSYIKAANALRDDGGDLHEEVIRLITTNTPYNVSRKTGRGDIDAQLNYQTALSAILSGKVKAPKFGQDGDKIKAGVTAQSISSTAGKKSASLSADAAEYARHLGLTDDQIAEAMERPIVSKS